MSCCNQSEHSVDQASYLFIGCEVLFREICHLSASSPNRIDHRWLSQGLHDLGAARMSASIQQEIDKADGEGYEAILLGFALCNNGVAGLRAGRTPLVIPRAHDCISFLLGSRHRYREYFDANSGTYFLSTGWLERDDSTVEDQGDTIFDVMGLTMTWAEMVEKYDEENAQFIVDSLGDMTEHYHRLAYIRMPFEDDRFLEVARAQAEENGWEFVVLDGDLDLLQRLLAGGWNDDFVVVQPGEEIAASFDDDVLCARCGSCSP